MPRNKQLKDPVAHSLSKLTKVNKALHLLKRDDDCDSLQESHKEHKKAKN